MTKDRVTEYRVVRASDLVRHPKNWRTHPESQRRGLESLLEKVGSVDVLRTFVLPDGRLCLFDGHLRADIRADEDVRVLVTDLTQEEADLVLATFDPVSAMAGADIEMLRGLMSDVRLGVPADVLATLEALTKGDSSGGGSGGGKDNHYTGKIRAPIYEMKGEKPEVKDLFDFQESDTLTQEVKDADLPKDVETFLLAAARRHVVFNYHKIAEYYAHASPDVQRLMERSALVIVDYDHAIEWGYVKVCDEVRALRVEDHPDEEWFRSTHSHAW